MSTSAGRVGRYLDTTTGQTTLPGASDDNRFRLAPRGISSYETLAKQRAHAGYAPLTRTKGKVDAVIERVYRTGRLPQPGSTS